MSPPHVPIDKHGIGTSVSQVAAAEGQMSGIDCLASHTDVSSEFKLYVRSWSKQGPILDLVPITCCCTLWCHANCHELTPAQNVPPWKTFLDISHVSKLRRA